jgi:hypothetical protein
MLQQWGQQLWLQAGQLVAPLLPAPAGSKHSDPTGVTSTLVTGDLVATARKLLGGGWSAADAEPHLRPAAERDVDATVTVAAAATAAREMPMNAAQTRLREDLQLAYCEYLNASSCQASVDWSSAAASTVRLATHQQPQTPRLPGAVGEGEQLLVVVYNPLAWPRREGVRLPLGHGLSSVEVTGG